MEAHFPNLKIKLLRCDNAREFIMGEVARICKDRGITIDSSIPYCPEQNSRAERFNRSLMEKSRAMILDSGFDKEEWPFVVKCAKFIINRSPSRTTKEMKTPYELFYGSRPNLKSFRVFGCVAWQHIDEQSRRGQISKLDPRAIEKSFIGYTSNGYILMEPSSKKTYRSCSVNFIENRNFRDLKEKRVQNTEENEFDPDHFVCEQPNLDSYEIDHSYALALAASSKNGERLSSNIPRNFEEAIQLSFAKE